MSVPRAAPRVRPTAAAMFHDPYRPLPTRAFADAPPTRPQRTAAFAAAAPTRTAAYAAEPTRTASYADAYAQHVRRSLVSPARTASYAEPSYTSSYADAYARHMAQTAAFAVISTVFSTGSPFVPLPSLTSLRILGGAGALQDRIQRGTTGHLHRAIPDGPDPRQRRRVLRQPAWQDVKFIEFLKCATVSSAPSVQSRARVPRGRPTAPARRRARREGCSAGRSRPTPSTPCRNSSS